MIYFMAETEYKLGRVKIGYTSDISKRLSQLNMSSPSLLTCVLVLEGDVNHERNLHNKFSEDLIKGEWFHLSSGLTFFIWGNLLEKGLLELSQEKEFYEFIGVDKSQGDYYNALMEAHSWGKGIFLQYHPNQKPEIMPDKEGVHSRSKPWAENSYYLIRQTNTQRGSMSFNLQNHLPCRGFELLDYVRDFYPETKRPKAYTRSWIRGLLEQEIIGISEEL